MIPISISGIDYDVDVSFFERLSIISEELISDTYFLTSSDNHGQFLISVHKNFYDKIKREVKINKILK